MLQDWDIVVVGHNSSRDLAETWGKVDREVRARVFYVDNGSSDTSVEIAQDLFANVIVASNQGLSAGNNIGAAAGSSRYVLYSNPDVHVERGGLALLEVHLDEYGGIAAPRLRGLDGAIQESARGWPTLTRQLANRVGKAQADYLWPVPAWSTSPTPWVLGAAIATPRRDIEAVGGWPEEYFLYYEDTELCLRYWNLHLPVWVLGDVIWTHSWARSSRSLLGRASQRHFWSSVRFYRSHPDLLLTPSKHYSLQFQLAQAKEH